jgi:hypothetical protein
LCESKVFLPRQYLLIDEESNITIEEKRVLIGSKAVSKNDIVYSMGLEADYFTIPNSETGNDFSVFQDFHSGDDQKRSLLLSLIAHLENLGKSKVINNPLKSFDFLSQIYSLELMQSKGVSVPDFFITNDFLLLENTDIFRKNEKLLWCYPTVNSPIKQIDRYQLKALFSENTDLPYLFMEAIKGISIRIWYFGIEPLMACWAFTPELESYDKRLEKYIFIEVNDVMTKFGELIASDIQADFFEVKGIVEEESGDLFVQAIDCDPKIMSLPEEYRNALISRLFSKFTEIKSLSPSPEQERETIYQTRILESQWAMLKLEGQDE